MKSDSRNCQWLPCSRVSRLGSYILGVSLAVCAVQAGAAEAETTEAETPEAEVEEAEVAEEPAELTPGELYEGGTETFNNWVELSVGGMLTTGSKAEAQERHRLADGPFGGIEDLHYQRNLGENVMLTLDGRALFDLEDYLVNLSLSRENLGFVRVRYQQFQTWYNGNGGYYRPLDLWFPPPAEALTLERGEFSFLAGLTLNKWPVITFEYIHQYRDGLKDSTAWGPANLGFHSAMSGTRGIAPAFYDIDERRDIFKLDLAHHIGNTDFGIGARYETADLDNARKMTFFPGEPVERRVTNREKTSDEIFSAHAFSETWFKNNVFLSAGFLFAQFDDNFSGSRIYGDDFDVGYAPNALNGAGYYDLDGVLDKREYVLNLNLMATPITNLTVVPSIRFRKQDWDSAATGLRTSGTAAAVPSQGSSDGDSIDVQERLDLRYTGVTNWVFFARGEWTQGEGSLEENGGVGQAAPIQRETEDERFFQKYTLGARYYPFRNVTFDFGGYYKNNRYDYDHRVDNTPNTGGNRYPAYLVMQKFETLDQYLRVTLRPVPKVTLSGRYEHQFSTIHTRPDPASGLNGVDSSEMTTHIFAGNIGWVPHSRLALQLGANYVISETETPTSEHTRAVLDARNNYWTVNINSTLVLDQKTDLNVGYFYYQSSNYRDNSLDGLPLGAEAAEHGVTALLTRRLKPNLRLNLRYAFFHSEDTTFGGRDDYDAHVLFSSLQYRF